MRFFHSLSFRLIALISVGLLVSMWFTTYIQIDVQSRHLERTVLLCARRTSIFARQALLHGMETNTQDVIWSTLTDIGKTPGVSRIRVYDKQGVIRYSTDRSELFDVADIRRPPCAGCHRDGSVTPSDTANQYEHIAPGADGVRIMQIVTPIMNEPRCWNATCHAHRPDEVLLGVTELQMSLAQTDAQLDEQRGLLWWASLFRFAVIGGMVMLFVIYFVHRPVKRITEGTKRLAAGDLDHQITSTSRDEIGELAQSFNAMAHDLRDARADLVGWSETLEQKVEDKSRELSDVQAQVLHMEKMASLGKLSSSIAHELNNPLTGILTYARLVSRRLSTQAPEAQMLETCTRDLGLIADEARRCGDIVKNLLFFARGSGGTYRRENLVDIITRTLRLVQHQIDLREIQVHATLPDVPVHAVCDGGQIEQAVLALVINAIEAMGEGGALVLRLEDAGSRAIITISDTGPGIPKEMQSRVFEPFFSTKESTSGTGLGLSIVYGIVQAHQGSITLDSPPGHGTTFRIALPVEGPQQQAQESEHYGHA